jgi:uncharacterized protein (TIGR02246 family)
MDAPRVEDHADHAADVAAIRRIIADVEKAFNDNDADLLVEHFAQNGSVVTAMGMQIDGRLAMLESARAGLAGPLRDERARYELADVLFVRPDVALAHKHAWAIDDTGEPKNVGHEMSALYVLVRENGRWWIVSRQNTLVPTR